MIEKIEFFQLSKSICAGAEKPIWQHQKLEFENQTFWRQNGQLSIVERAVHNSFCSCSFRLCNCIIGIIIRWLDLAVLELSGNIEFLWLIVYNYALS